MSEIDHIVLGAQSLDQGRAFVEQHLGVTPQKGGVHEGFGTHNILVGLGPCYLEVIAPDPGQPTPAHPRPFGLDNPALHTALEAEPKLIAWVARTPVLEAVVSRLGPRGGAVQEMRRGDLHWRMAFPPAGQAMGGLVPALIQWTGGGASSRLKDSHCRLLALELDHPEQEALRQALAARGLEDQVQLRHSPRTRLLARLRRPDGAEATLASA